MILRIDGYVIELSYNPIWPFGIEWHVHKIYKDELTVKSK